MRHRVGEKMLDACITPTVKHGGGSVMGLGLFGAGKVGDLYHVQGILSQHGYHSILQWHAVPSGQRLIGHGFTFQQDNDPKHTSKLCNPIWRGNSQLASCLSWNGLPNHPTSTQFGYYGRNWTVMSVRSVQPVWIIFGQSFRRLGVIYQVNVWINWQLGCPDYAEL